MGFLDMLNKGLQAGITQAQKKQGELEKYKDDVERYKVMYEGYDDRRLMEMYRSYNGPQKAACGLLLQERGYGKK